MRDNKGFTLIEVLISLAIMSVLVLGVLSLVGGATNSADQQAQQAAQNGQIRTAMQVVQNSLTNADRPLMYVPATKQNGASGACSTSPAAGDNACAAKGNEIIFARTEDRGPSQPIVYSAERFRLIDADGNTAAAGEESRLVLQRIVLPQSSSDRQNKITELSDPYSPGSEWEDAPTKVLLDKVQLGDQPENNAFFFFKASAGEEATTTSSGGATLIDDVGLVDINISRDADGDEQRYAAAKLKTSVYLRKVAGRNTLSNPVGCDNP